MVSAEEIVALQDRLTHLWHETASGQEADPGQAAWLDLVARSIARTSICGTSRMKRARRVSDAELAAVKRRIDRQSAEERPC